MISLQSLVGSVLLDLDGGAFSIVYTFPSLRISNGWLCLSYSFCAHIDTSLGGIAEFFGLLPDGGDFIHEYYMYVLVLSPSVVLDRL